MCPNYLFPEERLHKTQRRGGEGFKSHKKHWHSFWVIDTHLCNKHLLKHGGDLCSLANQFPTPTHSSHFTHGASIQPLLSPVASADWLTYGIALFCFSPPPPHPPVTWEPNSASCQSLLVFCVEKKVPLPFSTFFFPSCEPPESKRCVSIWRNTQVVLYMNSNIQVRQCFVMHPPAVGRGEHLLLPMIYWGSPK